MLRRGILLILLMLSSATIAATDAVTQLMKHLDSFTSMKANFKQVIVDENNKPVQNSSGSMVLKRPGLFRWYTHQPNRQILVVKDNLLYIYDIDLEQLTINPLAVEQDSAPAVLLNQSHADFSQNYHPGN